MKAKESFSVHGDNLMKKIKELIEEGNATKITINDSEGKEIMSFPVTVGVVGILIAPVFAAIGAVAALIGDCVITVERNVVERSVSSDICEESDHLNQY